MSGSCLSKSYGDVTVLHDLSFDLPAGSYCALTGSSGSGKSTLLRVLCGLERPDKGTLRPLPGSFSTGVLFQEPRLLPHLTVRENILLPTARYLSKSEAEKRAFELIGKLEIESVYNQKIGTLSGGEKRRVALARALLFPAGALLLDEPYNGLDPARRKAAQEAVRRHAATNGCTVLLVSHRPDEQIDANREIRLSRNPN